MSWAYSRVDAEYVRMEVRNKCVREVFNISSV
jgi:hypothetical protein